MSKLGPARRFLPAHLGGIPSNSRLRTHSSSLRFSPVRRRPKAPQPPAARTHRGAARSLRAHVRFGQLFLRSGAAVVVRPGGSGGGRGARQLASCDDGRQQDECVGFWSQQLMNQITAATRLPCCGRRHAASSAVWRRRRAPPNPRPAARQPRSTACAAAHTPIRGGRAPSLPHIFLNCKLFLLLAPLLGMPLPK